MEIRRGEIYLADLGEGIGSEQGGIRPVVILQRDIFNKYFTTVLSAPLTSKNKKYLPTHLFISSKESGLTKDSIVLAEQIRAISKERLIKKMGDISENVLIMQNLKKAVNANFEMK